LTTLKSSGENQRKSVLFQRPLQVNDRPNLHRIFDFCHETGHSRWQTYNCNPRAKESTVAALFVNLWLRFTLDPQSTTSRVEFCTWKCDVVYEYLPVHKFSSYLIITSLSPSQTEIKKHVMKAALKKGVEDGTLVQVKSSYKLSPTAKAASKKKPAKKPAAKKPAAKKTAAKKVS